MSNESLLFATYATQVALIEHLIIKGVLTRADRHAIYQEAIRLTQQSTHELTLANSELPQRTIALLQQFANDPEPDP